MAKHSVTNIGSGARVVNAVIGHTGEGDKRQPVVEMVHLAPGETKDVELLHHHADMAELAKINPVLHGMIQVGDLHIGKAGTRPPSAAEKAEHDAKAKAEEVETARAVGFEEGKKAGYAEGLAKGLEETKKK